MTEAEWGGVNRASLEGSRRVSMQREHALQRVAERLTPGARGSTGPWVLRSSSRFAEVDVTCLSRSVPRRCFVAPKDVISNHGLRRDSSVRLPFFAVMGKMAARLRAKGREAGVRRAVKRAAYWLPNHRRRKASRGEREGRP